MKILDYYLISEQPVFSVNGPLLYSDIQETDDILYTGLPTIDELLITNFPYDPEMNDVILYQLGESIFNKWQYLDYNSKKRVNNYFLSSYPNNWIFDINSFYDSESFIRYLTSDYSDLLSSSGLSIKDIIFLHLLDKSLSIKLKKEIVDSCEKTKITKITKNIWEKFSSNIKENVPFSDSMIKVYKDSYSEYDKDSSYIKKIYDLLKKCYAERNRNSKSFETDSLLQLFKGCDMDSFEEAIKQYEKNKKYLLNKKYLENKTVKKL